jgi:hypothetical protein
MAVAEVGTVAQELQDEELAIGAPLEGDAFTSRRSPCSSHEDAPSVDAAPRNPSTTTDGRDGSDVSVADAMETQLHVVAGKEENKDEEEFPDFEEQEDRAHNQTAATTTTTNKTLEFRSPVISRTLSTEPVLLIIRGFVL